TRSPAHSRSRSRAREGRGRWEGEVARGYLPSGSGEAQACVSCPARARNKEHRGRRDDAGEFESWAARRGSRGRDKRTRAFARRLRVSCIPGAPFTTVFTSVVSLGASVGGRRLETSTCPMMRAAQGSLTNTGPAERVAANYRVAFT